jgi:hypothetical protein
MALRPSSRFWAALLVGLAVGVGYPYIDLALKCRNPASEACVWGKAYCALTLGASVVLIGGVTAGLLYAHMRWRGKRGGGACA